jgi:subtilisin family serine protease
VRDIGLTNASVSGSQSDGSGWVGTLAGFNAGLISRSYATGAATGAAFYDIGGLVGRNDGTIAQSYADVATTGGANSAIGGLAGQNYGTISDSYARGAVVATSGYAGGLIGWNQAGSVARTYATGLVSAPGDNAGGLIGKLSGGTVTNSYWDTQTTQQSTSSGGDGVTPQTTAQLTSAIPSGFDPQVWSTPAGKYPCLASSCNPAPTPTPDPVSTPTSDPTPTPVQTSDPISTPAPDPAPQQTADPSGEPKTTPVVAPQLVATASLVTDPTGSTGPKTNSDPTPNTTPVTNPPGPSGTPGAGQNAGRPTNTQVPPPGLGPLPSGMPPLSETRFLSNEVVMQLGATMTPEAIAALARSLGLEVIAQQSFGVLGRTVFRFRIAGHLSVRDVIKALEANHVNVSAQPSYTYSLTQDAGRPAAPELASGADLAGAPADTRRSGDAAQYVVDKLRLTEAHTIATGRDVKVAVIDSEIDANHPDLQGVITATYDALPSSDQSPHPHGTGMAGAIASHRRLLGIAPGAKLLAVRAFGIDEKGAQGTSMNIVKGLEWAVAQGARVINMSFAGPRDPMLQQAIKKLSDDGIILIAAAGNAGPKSPPLFPGADANVIAVSATDINDKVYRNANRGKYIAIAAPGVDILVPAPDGGYQLTTGTSVAAAHISGVVALLKERNPQLKSADVRNILSASARNIGPVKTDVGAGLVDPVQALTKAGPKSAEREVRASRL